MRIQVAILISFLVWGTLMPGHTGDDKDPVPAAVRTKDGLIVVWNDSRAHFTLELPGKKFRQSELEGLAVFMDGFLVQIIAVDLKHFAPLDAEPQDILRLHMEFEGKHWAETVGAPMPTAIRSTETPLPSDALLWEIRWSPQARENVGAQSVKNLFLTAVVGDRVVSVSHPLMECEDEDAAYSYLEGVARSLDRQDSRIDLATIQERVRNE